MSLRERLRFGRRRQARLSWLLELALVGIVLVGIAEGSTTVVVNAAVGLLATQIPPLLERDYDVAMHPAIVLWITGAVFLHALGVMGLPGSERNFYGSIWWWDHLTHALSSSVVAGVGYATTRAIDVHSDEIHLPDRFVFVFILLFVLAFGVLWEVIEFGLGEAARLAGNRALLTQHGLSDTMLDLVFDTAGAVVVATWGAAYLSEIPQTIADSLARRRAD